MDTPYGAPLNLSNLSWPDIFSRHEQNLRNHVELCVMIKQHVVPESEAYRSLMGIISRTQELLLELEKLRSQFVSHGMTSRVLNGQGINKVDEQRVENQTPQRNTKDSPNPSSNIPMGKGYSGNPPQFVFDTQPTPVSIPQRLKNKKRLRDEEASNSSSSRISYSSYTGKKVKTKNTPADGPEDPPQNSDNTQYKPKIEFEDISDEVERRLRLREEQRQKRKQPPQKKRKRDSTGSVTVGENAPPYPKRFRGADAVRDGSSNNGFSSNKEKRKVSAETSEAEQGHNGNSGTRKRVKWSRGVKPQTAVGD
ncbi:hypothetical protein VTO42DRAFT_3062 [Malbranchea cinnamomea]